MRCKRGPIYATSTCLLCISCSSVLAGRPLYTNISLEFPEGDTKQWSLPQTSSTDFEQYLRAYCHQIAEAWVGKDRPWIALPSQMERTVQCQSEVRWCNSLGAHLGRIRQTRTEARATTPPSAFGIRMNLSLITWAKRTWTWDSAIQTTLVKIACCLYGFCCGSHQSRNGWQGCLNFTVDPFFATTFPDMYSIVSRQYRTQGPLWEIWDAVKRDWNSNKALTPAYIDQKADMTNPMIQSPGWKESHLLSLSAWKRDDSGDAISTTWVPATQ